jgi:hypothetical protein
MRTIVDIPDEELHELKEVSQREGISRAEAIRRAVRAYVCEKSTARRRELLDAAFGSWPEMTEDSVDYVRRLRSEWDERESRLR